MDTLILWIIVAAGICLLVLCYRFFPDNAHSYAFLIALALIFALVGYWFQGSLAYSTCPNCNASVKPIYEYCPDCGAPIDASAANDTTVPATT